MSIHDELQRIKGGRSIYFCRARYLFNSPVSRINWKDISMSVSMVQDSQTSLAYSEPTVYDLDSEVSRNFLGT